jgi:hypothetical protein
MNKRQFLGAGALAAALPAVSTFAAVKTAGKGPALLTLTGAIGNSNRGPIDPVRDMMMSKQKLHFDKAYTFDFGALLALPAHEIKPTLEYDAKVHTLRGPHLADVLAAAGVKGTAGKLALRAVDGYAASISLQEARANNWIVATHLDGQPMALGGLGPLWALYDADRVPQAASRPLAERFASCPWALYHIDVSA